MNAKRTWQRIVRTGLAIGLTTTVIQGGCSFDTLDAVVAGVGAAADRLDNSSRNDNIDLGDWLSDEFGNL